MANTSIGSKPFVERINVQSGEASSSIPAGTPVCLIMNGTGDGFNVKLPSSASALLVAAFQCGVVDRTMTPNDYGIAQVYGWVNRAVVAQQTRSASSASYSTAAALSIGQPLSIDTANDAFVIYAAVTGAQTIVTAATSDTIAANFGNGVPALAFLAQTLASAAASASTSSDSSLKKTYALKAFIRMM